MISTRYAWAAAGLLLFALVPTVANVYGAADPLPAGGLAGILPADDAAAGRRKAKWVETQFGATDFVSRNHGGLELFAVRSHDAKRLFHYPELALTYGRACTARRLVTIETPAGPLPVRVLEFRTSGSVHVAAYALAYGARPVEDPIPFLASVVPELFVGRREPMTLFYAQGDARNGDAAAVEADLGRLLARTWDRFRKAHDAR